MAKVFLAFPHSGPVDADAYDACTRYARADPAGWITVRRNSPPGCHCENFNALWCQCINTYQSEGWTHFAMGHSDVIPEAGWLDLLLEEMAAVGADVLSVVLPIKDERGLTSTAVQHQESLYTWRLTMRQVMELPGTFAAGNFDGGPRPEHNLLVSSGLWVCKTGGWMREVWFEMRDRIARLEDGRFVAMNFSEDWGFSRHCREQGLKVYATRKIKAEHRGPRDWPNYKAWGSWLTDQPTEKEHGAWLRQLPGLSSLETVTPTRHGPVLQLG